MATCGPPDVSSSGRKVTSEHRVDAEERKKLAETGVDVDALGLRPSDAVSAPVAPMSDGPEPAAKDSKSRLRCW